MKTVLYADTDLEMAEHVRVLVERAGYALLTAHDGHQALQLCQDENPDLILIDIDIAGVDGIRTVRLLRDDGYNNPIVVLTQAISERTRDQAIDAGCDDVVSKKGEPSEVETTLHRHLRDASGIF